MPIFYPDIQFLQLLLFYGRRRIDHHVPSRIVFWKSNEITDRIPASENSRPAVETKSNTAMGRGSVLKGIHQEAELINCIFFRKTKDPEHLILKFLIVNPDGTSANLYAVDHQVISIGTNPARIRIKQWYILGFGEVNG